MYGRSVKGGQRACGRAFDNASWVRKPLIDAALRGVAACFCVLPVTKDGRVDCMTMMMTVTITTN